MPVELIGDSARGEQFALVRLLVDGDRIVEADAPGLARDLVGLTLLEAAAVPGETLAADALANALGPSLRAVPSPTRIAVAMSGGVDSAVALHRAGAEAVGITLRLWSDPAGRSAERVCCSPAAVIAARETCHAAGLPHVTLDLREAFHAHVVAPFVDGYRSGSTPNPCVRCNGSFRFDVLVECARRLGAGALWTGHYARVVERDGLHLVARGVDRAKDQSYMLATVPPALLATVGLPLGAETKERVRAEAAAAGLAAARRPESQEACFLAGDDYRAFLARQGVVDRPGPVVDLDGRLRGEHQGLWRFTPGQRKGLGVAATEPLYAIRADQATNTLVVGPRHALATTQVTAVGKMHLPLARVMAQLRHRSRAVPATVRQTVDGFTLELDEPVDGVAPGQLAALYDDDVVVGAGEIVAAG